jgi:outer membrane protein TolC
MKRSQHSVSYPSALFEFAATLCAGARSACTRFAATTLWAVVRLTVMLSMMMSSMVSLGATPAAATQANAIEALSMHAPEDPAAKLAVWRRWRDPALQALLDNAHRNAPTPAAAEARLREARALLRQASAERKPAIDLGVGSQRSRLSDRDRLLDPEGRRYAGQHDLSLSWRWNLDLFGATASQRDAARWRADAEAVALEAARSELSAEVARQYVLVRGGDIQQRQERDLLDLLQQQQAIDDALADTGLLAEQERLGLRAEREAREASLRDGETGRRRALLALRALGAGELHAIERILASAADAGVDPTDRTGESGVLASAEIGGYGDESRDDRDALAQCDAPIATSLPVSALARRFDVRIAEYALRAATADTRAAQRARWPQLTLS